MTSRQEIEALINTYAYSIAQKVYEYCCQEYESLEKENKHLRTELTRVRNKSKGVSKNLLEDENKRLRKQNQELLKERNIWKERYVKCRSLKKN